LLVTFSNLEEGTLIRRYKRFLADVTLDDGRQVTAHVPNTGSMRSTRAPGCRVALSHQPSPKRKLEWTLEMLKPPRCAWVGVNTMMTNRIVEAAIRSGRVRPLAGYLTVRREVSLGRGSRIDFLLEKGAARCYIEVKNVTYKEGKRALFPDAVTERGTKHLLALQALAAQGHRAVIFFLVNRSDCTSMGPADAVDPTYGKTLREVTSRGVEALAYRANLSTDGVVIDRKLAIVV
jgi:sugar fermentation stimulation protein A